MNEAILNVLRVGLADGFKAGVKYANGVLFPEDKDFADQWAEQQVAGARERARAREEASNGEQDSQGDQ